MTVSFDGDSQTAYLAVQPPVPGERLTVITMDFGHCFEPVGERALRISALFQRLLNTALKEPPAASGMSTTFGDNLLRYSQDISYFDQEAIFMTLEEPFNSLIKAAFIKGSVLNAGHQESKCFCLVYNN